jgi:hypothetical protein
LLFHVLRYTDLVPESLFQNIVNLAFVPEYHDPRSRFFFIKSLKSALDPFLDGSEGRTKWRNAVRSNNLLDPLLRILYDSKNEEHICVRQMASEALAYLLSDGKRDDVSFSVRLTHTS